MLAQTLASPVELPPLQRYVQSESHALVRLSPPLFFRLLFSRQQPQPSKEHPVGDDVGPPDLPRVIGRGGRGTAAFRTGRTTIHAAPAAITTATRAADGEATDRRRPRLAAQVNRVSTREWERGSRYGFREVLMTWRGN